jgi:hypothetical protein
VRVILVVALVAAFLTLGAAAQSPNGSIGGMVLDPDDKAIVGAEIIVVNDLTRVQYETKTNGDGIYEVPNLQPGPYRIQVSKSGFKTLIKPDVILNVQNAVTINFKLPIGAASVVVTVEGGAPMMNTTDATVSTVVDRQFAENLPLNGRSFQTLIELTPGVVVTPSSPTEGGEFSVNGQRASANYWMVDGVGANIGINPTAIPGNGAAGALGSFSILGGTNSLVSVDALQEFRVQTSTYAPEFGRTPGGQISIVTRSGTNQFHGSAFDYLRNDLFDANDWFADSKGLPKPRERQNDFGGTLGGPMVKDRAFFFFSYEGFRLRLPQTSLTTVPDLGARAEAVPAMQGYLNAFPLPNGPADPSNPGAAEFNATYSNPASLDAYSLRIDDKLNHGVSLFGRYNYSPSSLSEHAPFSDALNVIDESKITTQTLTVGVSWSASPNLVEDARFNFSRTSAKGTFSLDNFGGAAPPSALPFPTGVDAQNSGFSFDIFSLTNDQGLQVGPLQSNVQRQLNFFDSVSLQRGSHTMKFGGDYRRLSPTIEPQVYSQQVNFFTIPDAQSGTVGVGVILNNEHVDLLFHNVGIFAQDTWRIGPRLTATYGVRWDMDVAPSSSAGPSLPAVTGYNPADLSHVALAPAGTPVFETTYSNFAPRFGLAYELAQRPNFGTVVRAGFGVFYDLATQQAGNGIGGGVFPFGGQRLVTTGSFPFDEATAAPPPISASDLVSPGAVLYSFDPKLKLPYTLEWTASLEQSLGGQQMVSVSYVGAAGRRLIQTAEIASPNASFNQTNFVTNGSTSDYDALQVQFLRRLTQGLQALASYKWSHSLDTGSGGSWAAASGRVPGIASAN